jgi:type I restriction enzyme S subunit
MSSYLLASTKPQAGWVSPALIDDRLEAEYYNPDYVALDIQLENSGLPIDTLGNISKTFTGPFGSNLPSSLYRQSGTPLLRVQNIGDFGINWDNLVFLDQPTHEQLGDSRLITGDLALAKSGSFGKIAPIWPAYGECNITEHILGIRVTDPKIDPIFLAAFLVSSYGLSQIKRKALGTILKYLGVQVSRSIKIPRTAPKIQAYIGDKVRLAEKCREEVGRLIEQSRVDLVSTLGFDLYAPPSTTISSSGSGYRLLQAIPGCILVESVLIGNSILPTRYQAQYLDRDMLLVDHGLKLSYLEDIAIDFINGYDCRDFRSSGTPYLRVGNIRPNELDLSGVMYVDIQPTSLAKKFCLTSGDLLITRKGSYGFCTSVTKEMEQMVFSSEIIRVPLCTGWDADYVALFLNSPYGRYQFDRLGTGTTMKGINHENLADIQIPKVPYEAQKIIGGKVRLSMALKKKSKNLITEACRDVEDLIDARLETSGILSGEIQVPTWNVVYQNLLTN